MSLFRSASPPINWYSGACVFAIPLRHSQVEFDQIVLSICPLAKHVKNHNGYKHSLSGISVNASHELVAHVALRRILDALVVVAQDLIAQL